MGVQCISSSPCDIQTGFKRSADTFDVEHDAQPKRPKTEEVSEVATSSTSSILCELDGNLNFRPVNFQRVRPTITVNIKTKMVPIPRKVPVPQPVIVEKEVELITVPKHVKPALQNQRLRVMKPVVRSHEMSGLCSIM